MTRRQFETEVRWHEAEYDYHMRLAEEFSELGLEYLAENEDVLAERELRALHRLQHCGGMAP